VFSSSIANYLEEDAAGLVPGGNAALKREATVLYNQCLCTINQAVQDLKPSASRTFRLVTTGDGSPIELSGPHVPGGVLVSVDITVKLQGLELVEAISELYLMYDQGTDERRDKKIKQWSQNVITDLRTIKAHLFRLSIISPIFFVFNKLLQTSVPSGRYLTRFQSSPSTVSSSKLLR
jgi:hypothetical protein